MTDPQEELDAIRARQEYGIWRNSDSNREGELMAQLHPIRTRLANAALTMAGVAMTLAPFAAIIKGIMQ